MTIEFIIGLQIDTLTYKSNKLLLFIFCCLTYLLANEEHLSVQCICVYICVANMYIYLAYINMLICSQISYTP